MKICNLQNGYILMICKIEISNYRFLFFKSLAYFHFANYRFLFCSDFIPFCFILFHLVAFRFALFHCIALHCILFHFANYSKPSQVVHFSCKCLIGEHSAVHSKYQISGCRTVLFTCHYFQQHKESWLCWLMYL